VSFDIETFKNVFLREPHVWLNFLSALGIAIKYPKNYEAIIYLHLTNTSAKPLRAVKSMYYADVINKACISEVKVQEYTEDNGLCITSNFQDMGVSVYEHLKHVSEGTLGPTKNFRAAQSKRTRSAAVEKPINLNTHKPVE